MIEVSHVAKEFRVKQQSEKHSFKNLWKADYKTVTAVQDMSFHIERGEMVGLIGLNGAGKTTTLKMLAGLIHPSEGTIHVDGFVPKDLHKDYLKEIGLVMGNKSQLWWDISSYESFLLEGQIYGLEKEEIHQRVGELAQLLDVADLLRTPVRKLSLGERMKMELILVLLHKPSILFLDEPTIGLDILSQKKLREFIKEYNKEHGATMLITSHNMKDVETLCERVLVIDRGVLIFDGKISDVRNYQKDGEGDFEEVIATLLEGGHKNEHI
ncbi:MAG: ATP-binding cassette domain-containing protein [Tissierellia bacterium]|nr:ATP-binding cassette domain-containing protein [Tissierellia bacterium]